MAGTRGHLLVDADVLIDYLTAGLSLLGLAGRHLGKVHVLGPVLDEVEGLDDEECEGIGLSVVEPTLEQLRRAAETPGSLSVEDHLCLLVARAEGWTCLTNDGALRRACFADGIPVLWGLEVMTELVRIRQLDAEEAVAAAWAIHEGNPFHIPESLVERFAGRARSIERERGGG